MTEPLVSVIIPCFNQGKYLAEAIESALNQTYPHVEVIVVNDGSTDNTAEVAARYGDRVRYVEQKNSGRCVARNRGLAVCLGCWVLFLDADDYLEPDMIFHAIEVSGKNAVADVIHGSWYTILETGERPLVVEAVVLPDDTFHAMLRDAFAVVHAVLIRTEALRSAHGWKEGLEYGEDWELWLRLAAAGLRFAPAPAAWSAYRRSALTSVNNYERLWAGRLVVMREARSYHLGCQACRSALAITYRVMRGRLYAGYAETLGRQCKERRWGDVIGTIMSATARHPVFLAYYMRVMVHGVLSAVQPRTTL